MPRARTALFAVALAILAAPSARAEDRHPYDDLPSHDRPEVHGDLIVGWRSSTTGVASAEGVPPSAWGVLFGMRADLYSAAKDPVSGRSTIDVAGGGGTWGDWRALFDFSVGKRVDLGGNSGFVARVGTHLHSVGSYGTGDEANARARDARIDLPVAEIAYQRTHALGLFELGVRNALTLYGFYAPGDDARSITLKPGLGSYVAWHHDDLHLELDAMDASIGNHPITFVNGMLCSTASLFALCGDARYVTGVVDGRMIASWHVGATIGVGLDFATLK